MAEETKNNNPEEDKKEEKAVKPEAAEAVEEEAVEIVADGEETAPKLVKEPLEPEKRRVKVFFRKPKRPRRDGQDDDFDQKIIDIARVTRVMAGGKRMRFRACVAIGDHKNKVGIGIAKGADVTLAVAKAVAKARKNMIQVPIRSETIPHEITMKKGAAKILFKPASSGRGVIAGGVVRNVIELSGIKNITSKILGTNNKVNNAYCAFEALGNLRGAAAAETGTKRADSGSRRPFRRPGRRDSRRERHPAPEKEPVKA